MKRVVLKFGLTSGLILAAFTGILMPLSFNGQLDASVSDLVTSELVGYSAMLVSFLAVFFGIRSYRDNAAGGAITFGRAFKVGILIALIGCAMYVIGWEIAYWGFVPDFEEKYAAASVAKMRERGASTAEIAAYEAQMAKFKEWYRNPLINVGMTFLEVFPVALIVTLVSAAILRRKPGEGTRAVATA